MIIPNLPTDNLYKFIALFGLVILIVSFITFFTEVKKMGNESFKIQKEININILEANLLIKEFEEVISKESTRNEIIIALNEKIRNPLYHNSDSLLILEAESIQLDKDKDNELESGQYNSLFNKTDEYQMNHLLIQEKNKLYLHNLKGIDLLEKILTWTSVVGFGLVLIGFYLWYFRLQVYQDTIIKETALEKNENVEIKIKKVRNAFISFIFIISLGALIVFASDNWVRIVGGIFLIVFLAFDIILYLKKKK